MGAFLSIIAKTPWVTDASIFPLFLACAYSNGLSAHLTIDESRLESGKMLDAELQKDLADLSAAQQDAKRLS